MNRIQFFILTGLSSLVVLLMISNLFLARQVGVDQAILNQAQQRVNQGQAFQANLKQLAVRIFQDSQKTQDQGLKDILIRNQITYSPASQESSNASEPTVPPSNH